jgi:hypothetical protein
MPRNFVSSIALANPPYDDFVHAPERGEEQFNAAVSFPC